MLFGDTVSRNKEWQFDFGLGLLIVVGWTIAFALLLVLFQVLGFARLLSPSTEDLSIETGIEWAAASLGMGVTLGLFQAALNWLLIRSQESAGRDRGDFVRTLRIVNVSFGIVIALIAASSVVLVYPALLAQPQDRLVAALIPVGALLIFFVLVAALMGEIVYLCAAPGWDLVGVLSEERVADADADKSLSDDSQTIGEAGSEIEPVAPVNVVAPYPTRPRTLYEDELLDDMDRVLAGLANEDTDTRWTTLYALGQIEIPEPEVADAVLRAADSDSSAENRYAAERVLAGWSAELVAQRRAAVFSESENSGANIELSVSEYRTRAAESFDRQEWASAAEQYRHVLELEPTDDDARLDLVTALIALNKLSEARAILKQVSNLLYDPSPWWVYLGDGYREQNEYSAAVEAFKEALQLNPENKEARAALEELTW